MFTLRPKSWLSWDYRVLEGGRDISFIDRHWFRERASFSLGRNSYDVRRTSTMRGTFVLEHAGSVIAEAKKPSPLRRTFEITVGSARYTLRPTSITAWEFRLLRGNVPYGAVRRTSLLRRTATAQFSADLPREVQLFVVFLVLILWKRAADASRGGGG